MMTAPEVFGVPLPPEMFIYNPNDPVRYQALLGRDMTPWYRERWRNFLEMPVKDLVKNRDPITFRASEALKQRLGYDPSFSAPANSILPYPLGILGATTQLHQWSLGSIAAILPVDPENANENVGYAIPIPAIFHQLTFNQLMQLTNGYNKPIAASALFADIVFEAISPKSDAIQKIATWRGSDFLNNIKIDNRPIGELKLSEVIPAERLQNYTVSSVVDLYQVRFNQLPNWQTYTISDLGEIVPEHLKVKHIVSVNPDQLSPAAVQFDVIGQTGAIANYTPALERTQNQSTQDLSTRIEGCVDNCQNTEIASSGFTNRTPVEGRAVVDRGVPVAGGTTGTTVPELTGNEPSGFKLFNPLNSIISLKVVPTVNNKTVDLNWYYQLLFLDRNGQIVSTPHRYFYNSIAANLPEKSLLILPTQNGQPLSLSAAAVPNPKNVNIASIPFCSVPLSQLLQILSEQVGTTGGFQEISSFLTTAYSLLSQIHSLNPAYVSNPDTTDYCRLAKRYDEILEDLAPPSIDGVYLIESTGNALLSLYGEFRAHPDYFFSESGTDSPLYIDRELFIYPEIYTIYFAIHNGRVVDYFGYYNHNPMCSNWSTYGNCMVSARDFSAQHYSADFYAPLVLNSIWAMAFEETLRHFYDYHQIPQYPAEYYDSPEYYNYYLNYYFNLPNRLQPQRFNQLVNRYASIINQLGNEVRQVTDQKCLAFSRYVRDFQRRAFFQSRSPLPPLPADAPITARVASYKRFLGPRYWYYTDFRVKPEYMDCVQKIARLGEPSDLLGFYTNICSYMSPSARLDIDRIYSGIFPIMGRKNLIKYHLFNGLQNCSSYNFYSIYSPSFNFNPSVHSLQNKHFLYMYVLGLDPNWSENTLEENLRIFNEFKQAELSNPIRYQEIDYYRAIGPYDHNSRYVTRILTVNQVHLVGFYDALISQYLQAGFNGIQSLNNSHILKKASRYGDKLLLAFGNYISHFRKEGVFNDKFLNFAHIRGKGSYIFGENEVINYIPFMNMNPSPVININVINSSPSLF